jgi:iron complex outermembrane receptor protein
MSRHAAGALVLAIAWGLAPSFPLHAQGSDDGIVVTATRFSERTAALPIGTRVITAEEIRASTARSLPELLNQLGGVNVRSTSGSPDLQVDLRGFGITGDQNTLVLLDGVRITEPDLSTARLSSIPLDAIERIEILPGGGAVQFGGGTSGGTINVITRTAQAGARRATGSAGYGSYDTRDYRASLEVAGANAGLSLYANRFQSDNYRLNNDVTQKNLLGDARWGDADAGLGIRFGVDRQDLRLPGALTEAQIAADRRQTRTPDDYSERDGGFATLTGRRRFGAFEAAADFGYRDNRASAFFKDYAFGVFDFYSETRRDGLTFSPRVRWEGRAAGVPSTFIAGYDWSDWDWNNRGAASPAGIGAPFTETDATQTHNAIYAQWLAQPTPALRTNLGFRAERVSAERVGVTAGTQQSRTDTPTAAELGLRYAATDSVALIGRIARSFRVATVDDNGLTATGDLLAPQTAWNYEGGAEYRVRDLALRANAYYMRLRDEIYFSPLSPNATGFFLGANVNLPPTERYGMEFAATWQAARTVDLGATLNLLRSRFREGTFAGIDVSGNDVPLVPEATLALRAGWEFLPRTRLAAVYTWVGRQRFDNDQANLFREMPSYGLADLRLSHERGPWRFAAAVNNLFEEEYFSYGIVNSPLAPTTFSAYPLAGRTFFASLEYRFH